MKLASLIFAAITLLASCRFINKETVSGDGNVTSRNVTTASFNNLEVEGAMHVRLKQDPQHSVRVETDANLQEYVEIFESGGTLVVRPRKNTNLRPSRDLVVYVSGPAFEHIDVSGASKLEGENAMTGNGELTIEASGATEVRMDVNVPRLRADISGSSHLDLSGRAGSFVLESSGASGVRAMNLQAEVATMDLSGASNAEITANKELEVEASGASRVAYRGPAQVKTHTSGASSVEKRD